MLADYLRCNGGNGIFYVTFEAPRGLAPALEGMERFGGKVAFRSEKSALVGPAGTVRRILPLGRGRMTKIDIGGKLNGRE